jgi:UPF0755 protein
LPEKIRNPKAESRNHPDPYQGRTSPLVWLLRLAVLFVVVIGCATASFALYAQWRGGAGGGLRLEGGSPTLGLRERLYLQSYLSLNAEALYAPAGRTTTPTSFTIQPGETAVTIAANLAQAGLLEDQTLFLNYARFYGLDSQLAAGDFTLPPALTVPELAATLARAQSRDLELRFLEGLRLEEMANYLRVTQPAQIDAEEFLALALRERPFDLRPYLFLSGLPAGASLEGFLFPDTYRVPPDADAAYLLDQMLRNFDRRVTPAMRQSYGAQGLSLREAVTLASIVQREAVLAEERPLIAGVFLNRLAINMNLAADPTVQYALGYQPESGSWWKVPLFLGDLRFDSPYNTYVYAGLPPGPIASPSLSALEAVANPTPSGYYFFVADCQAEPRGRHIFSVTFEEHLAHAQKCQ